MRRSTGMVVSSFGLSRDYLGGLSGRNVLDPLVVCGPSGVGKGTIIQEFMNKHEDRFGFSVSHTTRNPRPGEVNGVHYHFVSLPEFEALSKEDYFLETAHVHGNSYGTSWEALRSVQAEGKKVLLDIDVQGVQRLRSVSQSSQELHAKFIFIAPPSLATLQERLVARNTETPETLQRRLANAAAEVEYGQCEGNFDTIIVNDDLEVAVCDFETAVQRLYHR